MPPRDFGALLQQHSGGGSGAVSFGSGSSRSSLVMMPEGPEVRSLVHQLQPGVGKRLVGFHFLSGRYTRPGPDHKPKGWNEFHATLTAPVTNNNTNEVDTVVLNWNCKGKFIYLILGGSPTSTVDDGHDWQRSIWITLGMTGKFISQSVHNSLPPEKQALARWYMELMDIDDDDEGSANSTTASSRSFRIYYYDARNFGTLRFSTSRKELANKLDSLGLDILDDATNVQAFLDLMMKQPKPETSNICKFLMDQSKLAGVGNYLLAEGLYRANIDPFAMLSELDTKQQSTLFRELQSAAQEALEAKTQQQEHELQCYGRDTCAKGRPVIRDTNGPHGRTIWYTKAQLNQPVHERRKQQQHSMFHRDEEETEDEASDTSDASNATSAETSTRSRKRPLRMATYPEAYQQEDTKKRPSSSSSPRESAATKPQPELPAQDLLIASIAEESWRRALASTFETDWFQDLSTFVAKERKQAKIYPPTNDQVFTALNACPLQDVKVVILGQDPYHGPGQAHGLAFSVPRGVQPLPPSLRNIFKELQNEGLFMEDGTIPHHGCLQSWADQGVLLLNTVLTVRRGQANSHAGRGWEQFTDAVISALTKQDNKKLVFLLWGKPAAEKANRVIDTDKHVVLQSSHPSPLSASRTKTPFFGSGCFLQANRALEEMGLDPIDWNVTLR